jgi:hypothetical protein
MSSPKSPTLTYVESILKSTGFLQAVPKIVGNIEDEIAGSYESIDKEDDGDAASYGGVIYHSHNLIDDGNFDYVLDGRLNENQKNQILNLLDDNKLSLSVERTDWRQKWNFYIYPEITPNSNERLEIEVELDISVLSPSSINISAKAEDEDDDDYKQIIFMLNLSI